MLKTLNFQLLSRISLAQTDGHPTQKGKSLATGSGWDTRKLVSTFVDPTLRKRREGWGTRTLVGPLYLFSPFFRFLAFSQRMITYLLQSTIMPGVRFDRVITRQRTDGCHQASQNPQQTHGHYFS
jgi:hypothetical protein